MQNGRLLNAACDKMIKASMPTPQMVRVLIAHDEPLTREGLAAIINRRQEMKVVGHAATVSEMVQVIQLHKPDVMLIDLRFDGQDALEIIQKIRASYPSVAILILSSYEGSEDIYRALRAGVRGYLKRGVSDAEILRAIRNLYAGSRHIPDDIAIRLAERMDGSTLSERELQVLQLIVKGKSNKEIGDQLNITEGTVKFHVTGILTKLGVTDRTQAATAALMRGIVHPQDI
jgi:two-component system NarL family response regulator